MRPAQLQPGPNGRPHLATWEDLQAIPDDDNRYEILDGEVVMTPSPLVVHQDILRRLAKLVGNHIDDHDLGTYWFAPLGVRLGEHDIPEPDFLFVKKESLASRVHREAIHGPPELVVEILSEGTFRRDLLRKRRIYARYGVPEYWILDPDDRTVTVLTLEGASYRDSEPVEGLAAISS
jgi:Uma2 family endonuclease